MSYSSIELIIMLGKLHVFLIVITTTSHIHKSWSLHDLNYTKTRTGAFITQNQKDWRIEELQVESQNTVVAQRSEGTGRPTTTFEF